MILNIVISPIFTLQLSGDFMVSKTKKRQKIYLFTDWCYQPVRQITETYMLPLVICTSYGVNKGSIWKIVLYTVICCVVEFNHSNFITIHPNAKFDISRALRLQQYKFREKYVSQIKNISPVFFYYLTNNLFQKFLQVKI